MEAAEYLIKLVSSVSIRHGAVSKNISLNVIEARPNGNTKELTLGTQNLIAAHSILL